MKYPHHGPEVNAVLDVARAARRLDKFLPGSYGNIVQFLDSAAAEWGPRLMEIVLDCEEREEAPPP